MNAPESQVVITGMGLATCLGLGVEPTWRAVLEGRCGWGPLTAVEGAADGACHGGQAPALSGSQAEGVSREVAYLRLAIHEALRAAGAERSLPYAAERCGCILGTTLHGMRAAGAYLRGADPKVLAEFLAAPVMRGALEGVGLRGPLLTTCAACSSGLASVGLALTLLGAGEVDLVIAGGYDAISEYAYGGFDSLRLIAPGRVRPFCAGREGMNIAEGYAILVLERAADADARGAPALARVRGVGESSDCHHLTQPHPQGEGALRAIRAALEQVGEAGAEPAIGLVAAHATGTLNNDAAEYAALSSAFGERLADVPVVAFKSHLGHTLGGAGAAELILSAVALREQALPPTAGAAQGEVEFPSLRLTSGRARPAAIDATLNLSLGFGGANACAVLTRGGGSSGDSRTRELQRPVLITGVGVIAPGAIGNAALAALLASGPRAQAPHAGGIDEAAIAHLLNTRRVRRMSEYVKYTLAAATVALQDAGIGDVPAFTEHCAAILGTTHGSTGFCEAYYRQIVTEGLRGANPMLFAEGVPNAGAAQLSMMLQVKGPCQTLIGSRTSGLDALWLASLRIASGQWDRAIVGAAEEFGALVTAAYAAHGLRASGANASPFAGQGFHPGAGAAAIILESAESVATRGGSARGTVERGRSASAPGPAGRGVNEAVREAVAAIGAPDWILGSANGTWLTRAENSGIAAARWRLKARGPAMVSAITGYLGETFSVGPLAGLAGLLLTGRLPALGASPDWNGSVVDPGGSPVTGNVGVLCTDWSGSAAAISVSLPKDLRPPLP
jgi:3-oxoacyl-[acyl-carrier-protein] synthase II